MYHIHTLVPLKHLAKRRPNHSAVFHFFLLSEAVLITSCTLCCYCVVQHNKMQWNPVSEWHIIVYQENGSYAILGFLFFRHADFRTRCHVLDKRCIGFRGRNLYRRIAIWKQWVCTGHRRDLNYWLGNKLPERRGLVSGRAFIWLFHINGWQNILQ